MWTRAGNVSIGGAMTIAAGMNFPPFWGMYVGVPQLEEAIARIEALGGSTLSPVIEIPDVGRMRTMKDPQGAVFSIFEPSSPPPHPEKEAEVGDVSWHELHTSDAEAAVRFYTTLFGWRVTDAMDMGAMGKYHIFARAFQLGGIMNKMPEMAQVPPHWGFYFRVPDVNAGLERVKANGGRILNGPMEVPGGDLIVNCMDPQGAMFSLHQKK
jgi:predicted enzyme related to lactoylglutathione lyase